MTEILPGHRPTSSGPTRPRAVTFTWTDAPRDPEWDRFVGGHPLGHHTQSALWAELKHSAGWGTARVVVRRGGAIVGGAQILHRPLAWGVSVGYVSKGPLLDSQEGSILPDLLDEIESRARRLHIRHLTIQPVDDGVGGFASSRGYLRGSAEVTPAATVMVDVNRPAEKILAAMSSRTRYNVRLSGRRGIEVREGNESDLDTFCRIYLRTTHRQGFEPTPVSFFRRMWQVLRPAGHIRLALAEFEGDALSAQLAIAFGDTVVNKMSVWSGEEGGRRPNEALQWSAIEWAHEGGYSQYDLEGLPRRVAESVVETGEVLERDRQSVATFKLGFGGDVVLFPSPHTYVPNPALRWSYSRLLEKVEPRKIRRLIEWVRVRNR